MYEEFLAFAREQSGSVDLYDHLDCALARFLKHKYPGTHVSVGFIFANVSGYPVISIPHSLYNPLVILCQDQKLTHNNCVVNWKDIVEVLEHAHA